MQDNQNRVYVNDNGLTNFFGKVYGFMALALGLSALTAFLALGVFRPQFVNLVNMRFGFTFLILIEFALVIGLSFKAERNPMLSLVGFVAFSIVNGLTLAVAVSAYTSANVVAAFVSSVAVFGAMSVFGLTTKRNILGWGRYLIPALIGLFVATLINMFIGSAAISYVFSYISIAIFTGLTAYDNQRLKVMYQQYGSSQNLTGLALMGALQLYLDFINIFLSFLRIFGGGSRN